MDGGLPPQAVMMSGRLSGDVVASALIDEDTAPLVVDFEGVFSFSPFFLRGTLNCEAID